MNVATQAKTAKHSFVYKRKNTSGKYIPREGVDFEAMKLRF